MKSTHILVPIERYEELEKYNNAFDTIEFLDEFPKVDLSEKGIKNRAYKEAKEMTFIKDRESFDFGYQQCAKDLLKGKI